MEMAELVADPTSSELNITISDLNTLKIAIEVLNNLGQTVRKESYDSNQITLSTNTLSEGIYFIKVSNDELKSKVFKIIVNK